jgi:hypothetical protein
MLHALLQSSRQLSGFGFCASTAAGAVQVTGLSPDDDAYDSMPAGFPGFVPASTCLLCLFVEGDPQAGSGIGPAGWVAPG